ncbi:hypothetical protein BC629DRAFT_1597799 [Irpex lacteus]|nr:hypothetical protein BC629DRAFT_1597799 [Irpex lacteus]
MNSEYIDLPHNFGAEYDPYPDNRTRQGPVRSIASSNWRFTGNHQPSAASTPMATTTNVASPIPTVHRLTQNDDPTRTSVPFGSPVSLHGMSQTRPVDPATATWLTSSPTNVSYPATTRGTWMTTSGQAPPMRINDHGSLFQPMQASTPAPSRYGDSRGYLDVPSMPIYGHPYQQSRPYGAPEEDDGDSHESSLERDHGYYMDQERHAQAPPQEVDEDQLVDDMPEDSASVIEAEEELVPMNVTMDNGQEDMPCAMPDLVTTPPMQTKGKKKFVGGFWSGLKNFTGFGPKPSLAPLSIPAPTTTQPPPIPQVSRADTSHAGSIRPFEGAQRSPDVIFPHPELSHSIDHTPESHGPLTPDAQLEQSENPITIPDQIDDTQLLPNPHDDTLITAPVHPQTPQEVDLQPTADYDAMSEPTEEELPDATLSSHINRVGKFITDLIHLPWISPTSISEAYSPAESRRARYTGPKPGTSWYTKENHEKLDLLATPTQTRRRHPPSGTRPRLQTRPSDPPRVGVVENVPQAMPPYSYYYTSPQPLYVYPSPLGSPHVHATGAGVSTSRRRGRSGSDGAAGQPTPMPIPMPIPFQMPGMNMAVAGGNGQQGVPAVYMIAPAPIVLPPSNSPSRQHTHTRRGSRRNERERETGSRSSAASPRNSHPTTSNVKSPRRASNVNLKSTQPQAQVASGSTSPRATSRSPGPAAGKQPS